MKKIVFLGLEEEDQDTEKQKQLQDLKLLEVDKVYHDREESINEIVYDKIYDRYKETGEDITKDIVPTGETEKDSEADESSVYDSESNQATDKKNDDEDSSPEDLNKDAFDLDKEDAEDKKDKSKDEDKESKTDKVLEAYRESYEIRRVCIENHQLAYENGFIGNVIGGTILTVGNGAAKLGHMTGKWLYEKYGPSLAEFGVNLSKTSAASINQGASKAITGIVSGLTTLLTFSIKGINHLVKSIDEHLSGYSSSKKKIEKLKKDIQTLKNSIKSDTFNLIYKNDLVLSDLFTEKNYDIVSNAQVVLNLMQKVNVEGYDSYKNNIYRIKKMKLSVNKNDMDAINNFALKLPINNMKLNNSIDSPEDMNVYSFNALLPGNKLLVSYLPKNKDIVSGVKSSIITTNGSISFSKVAHVQSVETIEKLILTIDKICDEALKQNNYRKEISSILKESKDTLGSIVTRILNIHNAEDMKTSAQSLNNYIHCVESLNMALLLKVNVYVESYINTTIKLCSDQMNLIYKEQGKNK